MFPTFTQGHDISVYAIRTKGEREETATGSLYPASLGWGEGRFAKRDNVGGRKRVSGSEGEACRYVAAR